MLRTTTTAAIRTWTRADAATAVTSMALTEAFYHFHSFTLELAGFLVTWAALRAGVGLARRVAGPRTEEATAR